MLNIESVINSTKCEIFNSTEVGNIVFIIIFYLFIFAIKQNQQIYEIRYNLLKYVTYILFLYYFK